MARTQHDLPGSSGPRKAKREAVLREAAASFNQRGYHGTSLEDIAQRLGVTKPALYYYFPNKQAMLKGCFDHAMTVAMADIARARQSGGNGRERLRAALADLLDYFIGDHSVAMTVLEQGSLSAADLVAVKAARQRFEHALRECVREGIEDGSIAACDPKLAVLALLGALSWVPRWYRPDGSWTREHLSTQLLDLLERMVSASPVAALPADGSAAD